MWVNAVLLLALAAGACGATVSGVTPGQLVVSAAASLTVAFSEIEPLFEEANPGLDVVMNFGGSSSLREQILAGAPVDVFASADRQSMDDLAALVEDPPRVFARNTLQIGVPSGNPGGVGGLGDLAKSQLLVGLCAEEVPCGELARHVLQQAAVTASVDTYEPNVRALVTKLAAGELDAGIVYLTDVVASPRLEGVAIGEFNVSTEYLIGVLAEASDREAALLFVDFVQSEVGQAVLRRYGFGAP